MSAAGVASEQSSASSRNGDGSGGSGSGGAGQRPVLVLPPSKLKSRRARVLAQSVLPVQQQLQTQLHNLFDQLQQCLSGGATPTNAAAAKRGMQVETSDPNATGSGGGVAAPTPTATPTFEQARIASLTQRLNAAERRCHGLELLLRCVPGGETLLGDFEKRWQRVEGPGAMGDTPLSPRLNMRTGKAVAVEATPKPEGSRELQPGGAGVVEAPVPSPEATVVSEPAPRGGRESVESLLSRGGRESVESLLSRGGRESVESLLSREGSDGGGTHGGTMSSPESAPSCSDASPPQPVLTDSSAIPAAATPTAVTAAAAAAAGGGTVSSPESAPEASPPQPVPVGGSTAATPAASVTPIVAVTTSPLTDRTACVATTTATVIAPAPPPPPPPVVTRHAYTTMPASKRARPRRRTLVTLRGRGDGDATRVGGGDAPPAHRSPRAPSAAAGATAAATTTPSRAIGRVLPPTPDSADFKCATVVLGALTQSRKRAQRRWFGRSPMPSPMRMRPRSGGSDDWVGAPPSSSPAESEPEVATDVEAVAQGKSRVVAVCRELSFGGEQEQELSPHASLSATSSSSSSSSSSGSSLVQSELPPQEGRVSLLQGGSCSDATPASGPAYSPPPASEGSSLLFETDSMAGLGLYDSDDDGDASDGEAESLLLQEASGLGFHDGGRGDVTTDSSSSHADLFPVRHRTHSSSSSSSSKGSSDNSVLLALLGGDSASVAAALRGGSQWRAAVLEGVEEELAELRSTLRNSW